MKKINPFTFYLLPLAIILLLLSVNVSFAQKPDPKGINPNPSPKSGYITGPNNIMQYGFVAGYSANGGAPLGAIDIKGFLNGVWNSTTFVDGGWQTFIKVDGGTSTPINAPETGTTVNGVSVIIVPTFVNDGKQIKLTYIVHNTSGVSKSFSLGTMADVMIAGVDAAAITEIDATFQKGFKMIGNTVQFNFFGRGYCNVTDVDYYWYGRYGVAPSVGAFNTNDQSILGSYDSDAAWSWQNRTLEAGATVNLSVLLGIGGPGSEIISPSEPPVITVNVPTTPIIYPIGGTATPLTITVQTPSDGGTLTYQWFSNTINSTTGGTTIAGATNTNFTPQTTIIGTKYYFCRITNTLIEGCETHISSIYSAIAKVIVEANYTVTFSDLNGETIDPTSIQVTYNGTYGTLPIPTHHTYLEHEFNGWWTEPHADPHVGTQIFETTKVTISGDHTLYAHWTVLTKIVVDKTPQSVAWDGTAKAFIITTVIPVTTPSGFVVTYYKSGTSTHVAVPTEIGAYDVNIHRDEDLVLDLAVYNTNIHDGLEIKGNIVYNANGGTGIMTNQVFSIANGFTQNLKANSFIRRVYAFSGWNTQADGNGTAYPEGASITPTKNMILYAQWRDLCVGTISDIDKNVYEVVRIDNNCWTKKNMRTTKYADGSPVESREYINPNTNENLSNIYGYLYTYNAANAINPLTSLPLNPNTLQPKQGICPVGWRMPFASEIASLMSLPIESLTTGDWIGFAPTNSTGFSALPAGHYNGTTQRYEKILGYTTFWSCETNAYGMRYNCHLTEQVVTGTSDAVSVRCVKE